MASPTQGNGSISYAQFRHKGRPWYEWWWWHVMNKWNESIMCTPLQLNFPIQQQWTLLPPRSPCWPSWIRARGTQTGKKACSSIHYIYLQRTPQRESRNREKEQHQGIAIAGRHPLFAQSLFGLWGYPSSPVLSTMCRRCCRYLAGPLDYIQLLVHKQYSTGTQPCDSLYCNHNLDRRRLQPTKFMEA
jgi:hypothetical protein